MLEINKIYNDDCLQLMQEINDCSIDMILCDLPYGVTDCKYDEIIPFDKLWPIYERIIKDNRAIVLTASQPFTTKLISSNQKLFKYCWYWIKTRPTGFQHAKNKPLSKVEEICIFSKAPMGHISLLGNKRLVYNPQDLVPQQKIVKGALRKFGSTIGPRPSHKDTYVREFTNYPTNVLEFASEGNLHPAQKPLALFEYLIKTYSNEGDLVLDSCIGSATTCLACKNTKRNFIGIEKDPGYFEIAQKRVFPEGIST